MSSQPVPPRGSCVVLVLVLNYGVLRGGGLNGDFVLILVVVFVLLGEVLQDTVLNVAPVSCGEAHDMIMRMRGVSLLQGARGGEPADVAALADALVRVSELISTHPEISEIDLNPVFVHPVGRGVTVADAVIVTDVGVPSAPAPTAA